MYVHSLFDGETWLFIPSPEANILKSEITQDISPMKVVNRETRSKSFVGFLTGICAIIGGTLTVAAAVDRGVYEGVLRVKKMHQT